MYMDSVNSYYGDASGSVAKVDPANVIESVEASIVRAIVRGEQPLEALAETSIRIAADRIHKRGHTCGAAFLTLQAGDLAEGLLNQMHNPAALADWASFILVAGELFSFADRKSDACDRLLSAVWSVAFGGLLSGAAIRLAQSLRLRPSLA